jgi:CRP/FNR family transcriptional regulator, cyclic AMP receptor protein
MSADLWLRNPIFAAAGSEACAQLAERYPAKRYGPERNVVTSGQALEHLHVLLEGCVRVYHQTPDGLELTVKLLRAPVVYGDLEMFHDLPFLESVATVEDSTIARIPCDDYDAFLDSYPAAMRAHMVHIAAAFCVAIRNEQQLFASLDRRIANLVMAYAQVAGKPPPIGDKPAVALSQESIARSLGVVRRSVAGVLATWAKSGIVRKRGNYLVLEQPEVLQQLCAPIANSLPYWIGIPLDPLSHAASPEEERRATLELVEGPPALPVGQKSIFDKELVVGGDSGCGLQLPPMEGTIAPRHCRLFRSARGGRYWVQALSSRMPTLLNDAPVTRAVLRDGDVIGLGPVKLKVGLGRA